MKASGEMEGDPVWQFYKFALIVTGSGERQFLPSLFTQLMSTGRCNFKVERQIGQRSPITSPARRLKMVGKNQTIPTKDETDISIPIKTCLRTFDYVILIDDLEHSRSANPQAVFDRYRRAVDLLLDNQQKKRVSVHFLVNMLEAYYFADASAINMILGTSLTDHPHDVESIPHPKNDLKKLARFDEVSHGAKVLKCLRLDHVLANPSNCRSLRTMIRWCCIAMGEPLTGQYRLLDGAYFSTTESQSTI